MLILLVWGPRLDDHWGAQDRAAGSSGSHRELLTPTYSPPLLPPRIVSIYFPGPSSGLQVLEGQHCDFSIVVFQVLQKSWGLS